MHEGEPRLWNVSALFQPNESVEMGIQIYLSACGSGEKKKKIDGLPVFRSIPLDDVAQWSSYLHYCPCSWKDLASCWLPSHVLIDFCPLLLPTCVPFPFPPVSHLYFPFRRLTFHQKAGSSRNLPCLDLQNLFNQKSQGYIFLYFVVWGLVVLFISLFLGGIFCSSALS